MTSDAHHIRPQDLSDEAIKLVKRWLSEAQHVPTDSSAKQLAGVLQDPHGLDFTIGFVDGVVRPEDKRSAAAKMREISAITPQFLPAPLRGAVKLGGTLAPLAPQVVVPIAQKVLRQMVSHLIIDATPAKLGRAIAKIKQRGVGLNINLLGEAILGQKEATRRLAGTTEILARDDVDYVSIKVSATVAPHNRWAFDAAVAHITEELLPLYRLAIKDQAKQKFINLDMEEYKDLDLTIAVFTKILERPEFKSLSAGIVLQAYLPDALSAMIELQEWAQRRVADGGAPIKVRVVKGANLPMEIVDATLHGWESATWSTKQESDTSYKAVIDYALHPERVKNVRLGVAGHNLFDIALAWLLAKKRNAVSGIEFEMLLGMATAQAEVIKREVGSLLLYVPVVKPQEFDVAIAYLIRRLEEGASQENFMSAVFEISSNSVLFAREKDRFLASLAELAKITADGNPENYSVPVSNRQQDRRSYDSDGLAARVKAKVEAGKRGEFSNTPDTDPDLPGNREWGREIASRMVSSELGKDLVAKAFVKDSQALNKILADGVKAATSWQNLGAEKRAEILCKAGEILEQQRAQLLEVMGSECGKTIDQSDPEISEAIDFANYYAMLGQQLERVDGAKTVPQKLVAVIPPWNFPAAITAGGILAGLASGASVIVKPASNAARTGALIVAALWEAGVPRNVLQFVQFSDYNLASELVSDPQIDRLILTGSYETAVKFRKMRQDLPILAETSGKNAIIVTPNADLDLAAKDVAQSAFGHAGQKCSAASLVILVGSVANSKHFKHQLLDAVKSIKVGSPEDLDTQMSPVIAPPKDKLLRGLTELSAGEKWIIKPEPLQHSSPLSKTANGETKLWSPGVRAGVKRGSEYHLTEYFGPILGIMTAATLDEAISIVNDIEYGLTGGLHSLDSGEMAQWLSRIEVGNAYINRGITGAIVRRQPFGGWKKSAIGAGYKAGGPNYLHGLVEWQDAPTQQATPAKLHTRNSDYARAAEEAGANDTEVAWLASALASDTAAFAQEFGINRDASELGIERNILRYLPASVVIRVSANTPLTHTLRVVAAGVTAGSLLKVSTAESLPEHVAKLLEHLNVAHQQQSTAEFNQTVVRELSQKQAADYRVRVIGSAAEKSAELNALYTATEGSPDVSVYAADVVRAGRVELLPFMREQAVSITAHRFGTPNQLSEGII
ncbi:proline dehydrogenase family protein [Canibacter sp. lx-72]|uniref:proline dehydrogenase family protein n=1 Tax=Canibacter zhuwentaonis TaxID=2837491 RepID=UPI001BDDA3AA|nr:proline dehydrogenase family protein [Canibacter zhuwentaonis]MBT1018211.1 proline dehydrogenase family protein [Canibacter zhuwentaonis]